MALLTGSRISAGILFASIPIAIFSKCYATRSYLHHSWLGAVLDFEPTHDKPDQYWAVKISEFEAANKINNNFDGLVGAIKEFSGP